jgi:hypothetical protein
VLNIVERIQTGLVPEDEDDEQSDEESLHETSLPLLPAPDFDNDDDPMSPYSNASSDSYPPTDATWDNQFLIFTDGPFLVLNDPEDLSRTPIRRQTLPPLVALEEAAICNLKVPSHHWTRLMVDRPTFIHGP